MRTVDPFLAELEHESATTRRLLEKLPEAKLAWKPHEKAMSLGELASHVARIPAEIAGILGGDSFDVSEISPPESHPTTVAGIVALLDESTQTGQAFLNGLDDAAANATWRLTRGDEELFALPRAAAIRSFMLNHIYHHRGQVSTYLRIAGEYVPSVYGPTADDNPFA